jgi:dienelactone hydrolase
LSVALAAGQLRPATEAGIASSTALHPSPSVDFIPRSGRALVFPAYWGTYERAGPAVTTPLQQCEEVIRQIQDFRRTLDYLETRPDFNRAKLAYIGTSRGAALAPLVLAMENRVKAAVLLDGGIYLEGPPSEVDAVNFAPPSAGLFLINRFPN